MVIAEIGKIKDIAEIRSRSLKENFDFETFEKLLKVYYRIKFLDNLHFEKIESIFENNYDKTNEVYDIIQMLDISDCREIITDEIKLLKDYNN